MDHRSLACPPIYLESLYNIRDLGGYPAAGGRKTRCGRFIRSDAPVSLSETDLETLLAYPVRHVIDLRSESEIRQQPHDLKHNPAVHYVNIPLLGTDLERDLMSLQQKNDNQAISLADLYRHILDQSQKAIGTVMQTMARAEGGARLFNCSHGKDRTGLIAALLLSLADVDPGSIIEDYRISEGLLKPWFDTFIQTVPQAHRHFFVTPPRFMKETLDHLSEKYHSASEYLLLCGVLPPELDRLRHLLLEP